MVGFTNKKKKKRDKKLFQTSASLLMEGDEPRRVNKLNKY